MVTTFENDDYVYDALQAGARGFFTRKVRAAHGDRLRLVDPGTGLPSPTLVVV